jgi:hypothetical protein
MGRVSNGGKLMDLWMSEGDQLCEMSLAGRALKFALPDKGTSRDTFRYPSAPIYVFHNSWYLRAPVTATGAAVNLRHWNNAMLFCEPGTAGYHPDLCAVRPARLTPENCGRNLVKGDELTRLRGDRGAIPFFDCFRWLPVDESGQDRPDLESEFDYDVSANGFPTQLRRNPKFEQHGRVGDPGFAGPAAGDFRLKPGALAARSACQIHAADDGRLTCRLVQPETSFAGAISVEGTLYKGPDGPTFTPPP